MAAILSDDYTRAEFLRDRLIPKAVLFFTGEAITEEDEDVSLKSGQTTVSYRKATFLCM